MDFSRIDVLEDVGTLYTEYKKNNQGLQITESEFFKFAFQESIAEMDVIRQQYKSVLYELNNKKTELKDISDDNEALENENKLLTNEIDTLKAKINLSNEKVKKLQSENHEYKVKLATLEQKLVGLELEKGPTNVKTVDDPNESKHTTSERSYVEKHELMPIQTKIEFLEKLVCTKLGKMNLEEKSECSNTSFISVNEECTEWWCPKHSSFINILLSLNMKEESLEDQYLVRKAKSRFVYWQGHDKNNPRCPMNDRKKGKATSFQIPKCWPQN